jgi:hypothetical protein
MENTGTILNDADQVFKEQFEINGFAGPVKIFPGALAEKLSKQLSKSPSPVWSKGHAVSSRDYYDIATNPAILDHVSVILG